MNTTSSTFLPTARQALYIGISLFGLLSCAGIALARTGPPPADRQLHLAQSSTIQMQPSGGQPSAVQPNPQLPQAGARPQGMPARPLERAGDPQWQAQERRQQERDFREQQRGEQHLWTPQRQRLRELDRERQNQGVGTEGRRSDR